jgi:hypothetical protein
MAASPRWVKIPEYCYGQKIFQWVIMPESPLRGGSTSPEWWVNIKRNGGSTCSGIYKLRANLKVLIAVENEKSPEINGFRAFNIF